MARRGGGGGGGREGKGNNELGSKVRGRMMGTFGFRVGGGVGREQICGSEESCE